MQLRLGISPPSRHKDRNNIRDFQMFCQKNNITAKKIRLFTNFKYSYYLYTYLNIINGSNRTQNKEKSAFHEKV